MSVENSFSVIVLCDLVSPDWTKFIWIRELIGGFSLFKLMVLSKHNLDFDLKQHTSRKGNLRKK